ncbi:MAG: hypothetical protein PHY72_02850 [Candidatus Pacebacteria bacterium]|nr:hypothetical protein [Candidatus Paceibacterota bacterium]
MENIIIANQEKFEQIKAEMKKGGALALHILADFDRTLTKTFVNQKKVGSLLTVLRESNILPQEYRQKSQGLFDYYHPLEIDGLLSKEEKKKMMAEWWSKAFDLMISFGFNKIHLQKIIDTGLVEFREKAKEFFEILNKNDIPLVIISASGAGEAIGLFLKKQGFLSDDIFVISNSFEWDKQGKATRPKLPVIHTLIKDEILIKEFPEIFAKVESRKNVILLGDNIEDGAMTEGFEYDNLIKIGFLNEKVEENLGAYKKYFDAIILNDGSMDFVNKFLREITS